MEEVVVTTVYYFISVAHHVSNVYYYVLLFLSDPRSGSGSDSTCITNDWHPNFQCKWYTSVNSYQATDSNKGSYRVNLGYKCPAKLVREIHNLDFVDRSKLVLESWNLTEEDPENTCCHRSRTLRRGPVIDILLWMECYATLIAVWAFSV